MKIVAILGSPHGMKGSTGPLMQALLEGVAAAGAQVQTFLLSEKTVQPCRGCEACHVTGNCPIRDDFAEIKAAMVAADGLVLASPNYVIGVTAQMKALIDRLSEPIHIQEFDGKYVAAVVTAGSDNCEEVGSYILRALRMTGCLGVGTVGATGRQLANPETREEAFANAAALGMALVEAIRTRQVFPEQEDERQMIRERMRQLVHMRKDQWPFEYAYWAAKEAVS
jgi:multimeric flavodoxin WrbA